MLAAGPALDEEARGERAPELALGHSSEPAVAVATDRESGGAVGSAPPLEAPAPWQSSHGLVLGELRARLPPLAWDDELAFAAVLARPLVVRSLAEPPERFSLRLPLAPRVLGHASLALRGAVPVVLPPVDYNLGKPERGVVEVLRALSGVVWINWVGWQFDWFTNDRAKFIVTRETLKRNFEAGFGYDQDSFKTNFFGHPYHGSLYFGSARGAGLDFWESLPLPWFGSFIWEYFGETQLPSVNDFIATSFGGTVLGEALFRLSNEVFDDSLRGPERLWRELGGSALSPMYGVQRFVTGRSFADGAPPLRNRRVDIEVQGGINRLSSQNLEGQQEYEPSLHVGLDVEYGDLLPRPGRRNIEPYQFFEGYATCSFMPSKVVGAQLYIQGPMYGWNTYLSDEGTSHPDNRVFAVTQFIDFESSNLIEFGGAGLGVGEYLVLRFRNGMRYRLSGDAQFAVLSGVTSLRSEEKDGRTYNFSVGGTVELTSRFNMLRYGELGFRGRHYVTVIIDTEGTESIGYYRFWYELPLLTRMGIGVAPILAYRSSSSEGADPRVLNAATIMGELYMFGAF